MRGIQKQSLIEKGMIRSRKSPLYRGLTRIFIVVTVVWTGLILYWLRSENFQTVRPDEKMTERLDLLLQSVVSLSQDTHLPQNRRRLIQKALDTETETINGRQRRLSTAELKA